MTLIGSAAPAAAAGITWYVDAASAVVDDCGTTVDEACATITEAVGLAGNDDIVSVAPGSYSEVVRLDKPLTVAGSEDGVVLDVPDGQDGPALIIGGAAPVAVTVSTMTVRSGLDGNAALQVEGGSTAALTGVTVNGSPNDAADPSPGIRVTDGSTMTLTDSTVAGNGTSGLLVRGGSTVTVTRTTFTDNGFVGVQLGELPDEDPGPASTLTLTDSTMSGGAIGLYVFAGAATVSGGSVEDNHRAGIATETAAAIVDVRGTSFTGNGSAAAGDFTGAILLRQNGTVTATGVSITENYAGAMAAGGSLTIADSEVTDNVGDENDDPSSANGVGIAGIAGTITVGDDDPVPVRITVTGSEVSRNITGMTLVSATAKVTDSTIADNPNSGIVATGANNDGLPQGDLELNGSTVSGNGFEPNSLTGRTGVYVASGKAAVAGTTFSGNEIGMWVTRGSATVSGGAFVDNASIGLFGQASTVEVADIPITGTGHDFSVPGGAVPAGLLVDGGEVTGRGIDFAHNIIGAAAISGTLVLSDSVVRDNLWDPQLPGLSGFGIAGAAASDGSPPPHIQVSRTEIVGNTYGVWLLGVSTRIDSSTIAGNSDAGLVFSGSGSVGADPEGLVLTGSTVANNGATPVNSDPDAPIGGLWIDGAGYALVGGSIFQASEGVPTCAFDSTSPGTLFDGGHNVVSDDGCPDLDSDTSITGIDPKLGPLADNGSENGTRTMLPGDGSPAIDLIGVDAALVIPPELDTIAAQNLCAAGAVDQNGVTRPLGDGCEAGAVEAAVPSVPPLQILTESLPEATTGEPYNAAFAANGGNGGPYTWAIVDGELPQGLEFHPATGNIDGTPLELWDAAITVQVSEPDAPAPTPTGGPSTTVLPPTSGVPTQTGGPSTTAITPTSTSTTGSFLRNGAPAFRVALAAAPDPVTKEFTLTVVGPAVPTTSTVLPTTSVPTTAATTTASETPSETAPTPADTTTRSATVTPSATPTVVSSSTPPVAPPPAAPADPGGLANTGLDVGAGLAGGLLILLLGVGLYFFGRPRQRGIHKG